jgi:pimeloyl-ACP methyl ester carboxylesterase
MKPKLSLLFVLLLAGQAYSQLPRRVFLGIKMENLTDDSRKIMELGDLKGVLIAEVFPNSTASEAGLKKGDILLSINNSSFNSTDDVFRSLSDQKAGDAFNYEIFREKKKVKGKSVFKAFPEEKYKDLDVIYADSKSAIGQQRIIITRPKQQKRFPVVAFIGGIGCYSLDFPMDTTRVEVQLLNSITRAGYLCARLEKPGMGDNAKYCKACKEVNFEEETTGYVEAIKALKKREDVDSNSIYIIGHSMGGVFAPLVSQRTPIKGIIAYGTIGSNFLEYLIKTRRTIGEAYKMPPEETDQMVKDFCECATYYFAEKLSTADAGKKNKDCEEYLSIFDLRSRAYNDQLYGYNIPALWKPYSGKALIIWGESDFISSAHDHQLLTDAINYYHKGNAELLTIKNSSHGMTLAASFSEAQKNPGSYNPEIAKAILSWLKKQG